MEKFEPHVLLTACKKCVSQPDKVLTDHYLCIYDQSSKLFTEWGVGAAFKDAEKCVKKAEIRRVTGAGCHYKELRALLQHERDVGEQDGSRAFVTLHRRLAFAVSFLQALHKAVGEERKFQANKRLHTYKASLSMHQAGLTQSAVKLALLGMPGRRGLLAALQKCCHGDMSATQALDDITTNIQLVHEAADKIIEEEWTEGASRQSSKLPQQAGTAGNARTDVFAPEE